MSLTTSLGFTFFPTQTPIDKHTNDPSALFDRAQTPPSPFSFPPSSPATSGGHLDPFDLSVFDDPAYPFDFGPATPQSVELVSPKTSFSVPAATCPLDVEALSTHHLQRYLHYKALAEATTSEATTFDALFESMQEGKTSHAPLPVYSANALPLDTQGMSNMLAYQAQMGQAGQYYGVQSGQDWGQYAYQAMPNIPRQYPPQLQSLGPMHVSQSYMPNQRTSYDQVQAQNYWSRQPVSTSQTIASLPFPSTPVYSNMPIGNASLPTPAPSVSSVHAPPLPDKTSPVEIETEMEDEGDEGEDELSDIHGDTDGQDTKPVIPGLQSANISGGGRGYVPGKTPDDPKKRHKCKVCGRGFARAFNLKSHIQTHNPLRAKPHQCPHSTCKRGFSRLHDLERHRQGIHADGPIIDAKRIGVTPSIVRAKSRAESPRLDNK